MSAPKGVSVLASLTSEVMETKKRAARQLTPVAGEAKAQGMPAVIAQPTWPSDLPGSFMSKEGMRVVSTDLRRHAATLVQIADALDGESGFSTAPSMLAALPDPQKEREREADAHIAELKAQQANDNTEEEEKPVSFDDKFKAQQQAAQAAVYGAVPQVAEQAPAAEQVWTCPIHQKPGITKVSPRSGRAFIGCPDCHAFAR